MTGDQVVGMITQLMRSGAVACEHCNADLALTQHGETGAVILATVYHDDGCPVLARAMS
jgi:hypothetical protein